MLERIQSLEEFWPYYLSEHRSTISRRLHFVGTTGFLASVAASAITNPIGVSLAAVGFGVLGKRGLAREKHAPSLPHVAAMLGLGTLASPVFFPAGVMAAYGCAWIGHFGFEKNRPATFHYPLMSLVSDFRMYGRMLRGQLWSGDPLEELGLEDPRHRVEDATVEPLPSVLN